VTEESIFAAALEISSPAQRATYLDRACDGDSRLRRQVEDLLAAHAADNPLDRPAIDVGRTGAYEPGPADTPPAAPGDRIGPFRLMEQIGEGGFGLVFVAEQSEPVRRKVALKVLKPGMDTRDIVARFEAERQALALMDHPNIARVLDAGATDRGRPYFVMELVRGVPITNYCDENRLPPRDRLALFIQVCQAVQHAHQKGIIHRDLKPTNILVAPHDGVPVVKVIDFGVAKALGQSLTEKTLYTKFAQMIGTPLYMSPEQAEINQLDVDTRADVYALGVLLYELLTGTTPFDKDRFRKAAYDEIRRIIREEDPPKPSTRLTSLGATLPSVSESRGTEPGKLAGLVRGELDWIVMKCLEKDRNRRYDTANGLAKDIQRYLAGDAVEACPPTLGYRLRKLARRYKAVVTIAGALAAVLLLGIALTAWQAIRATRAEMEAARQRDVAMAAREIAATERDHATAVSQSLQRVTAEQRRTLYATSMNLAQAAWESGNAGRTFELLRQQRPKPGEEDLRGFEWSFWERFAHEELKAVRLAGLEIADPEESPLVLSPDGGRVAALMSNSAGTEATLKFFDADTGRELWAVPAQPGQTFTWMRFSGDGRRFVANRITSAHRDRPQDRRFELRVWDTDSGKVVYSVSVQDRSTLAFPSLSADGSRLAYAILTNPGELSVKTKIIVRALPSGEEIARLANDTSGRIANFPHFSPDGRRIAALTIRMPTFTDAGLIAWDIESQRELFTSQISARLFSATMDYSPDGGRIVTSLGMEPHEQVIVWDAMNGKRLEEFDLPLPPSRSWLATKLAFDRRGTRLAVVRAAQAYVYDVSKYQSSSAERTPRIIRGHEVGINGVAFGHDGGRLVTLDAKGTLRTWDLASRPPQLKTAFSTAAFRGSVRASPDGSRVAIVAPFGEPNRYIKITDSAGHVITDTPLPQGHCDDTAFSRDSRVFAFVWHEGTTFTVYVWDAVTGKKLRKIPQPPGWNAAVGLSPDGSLVFATSIGEAAERPWSDTSLTVWETGTGRQGFSRSGLETEGDCWPVVCPDGKRIAVNIGTAAKGDCRVLFLDVRTGKEVGVLKTGSEKVRGMTFSDDGRLLAVTRLVGETTVPSVWEVEPILAGQTREPLANLVGHGATIERTAFNPDGRRILTCGGGVVKMWDAVSGRELLTLKSDAVNTGDAFFSPDGRTVWGGLDENGRLWGWDGRPMTGAGSP
jgi:serine/threonine protein kinase/WD40 repeat protein